MKVGRIVRATMISLAALGLCLPQLCFAAPPVPAPAVADVALADGGTLHGRVVDLQGAGLSGVDIAVKNQNQEVVRAKSSNDGQFSVPGLRGGVYQVAAGQGQGVYRMWATNTAPPSAQKDVIVYTQCCPQEQCCPAQGCPNQCDPCCQRPGGLKALLTNPIVIAGVVATAIAVPVALANSHHASP